MPTKKGNPKLRGNQIHGLNFRRQRGIGSYIVAFFCPERKLVIEVDGDVHAGKAQQAKDRLREDKLKSLGFEILHYTNDEMFNNLTEVLEDLSSRILKIFTSPVSRMARPAGRVLCLRRGNQTRTFQGIVGLKLRLGPAHFLQRGGIL